MKDWRQSGVQELVIGDTGTLGRSGNTEKMGRSGDMEAMSKSELHVEAPEEVTEGETADLTCNTTCSLTDPTFIWYKNGRPLTTKTIKNNQLHLQTVSSEDAGSYSCAVRGSQHLHSTAHRLRVRYPPKNVSVSISPSGEIVEGSSVTLTCSSDGNPPVKIYTWFKGSTSVGEGKTYSIPNTRSEDSGEYTCWSRNDHGERRSTAVQINVLYPPKSVSVSINPSGEIVEGSSVTLTCSSDGNPPVKIYTWFKEGGTSPVGSGHSYSIISITADHTGLYYCEAQNDHGALNGTVMVSVKSQSSSAVWFAVGGGSFLLITVLICICRINRKKRRSDKHGDENTDPNAQDDTYTALQPRSSDDVYHTLAAVQSSSPDDPYTAQDPQSRSPEYDTLAAAVMRSLRTAPPLPLVFLLMAVDLHVEAPEEVTEGETADLTCNTTCSLTDPTFIWYKDGRPLTTKTIKNNQLHLQTVSSEDAGSYSCAVRGSQHLHSTAHSLRVRLEGSSVTLTCSSDGNPPVKIYTWFKEGGTSPVGSGHSYSIISITADHTGLYYCEAQNDHGALNGTVMVSVKNLHVEAPEEVTEGETADLTCNTTCSLTDPTFIWYKDGRPLTTKTIKNNQLHLQTVSSEDAGSYSCAVRGSQHLHSTAHSLRVRLEGSSVTLTCSSDGNPPVKIYTWFKEGGTSPVGSGHSYSIISITADHTGLYYCEAQNDHGALNGTVMVSVKTAGSEVLYAVVGLSLCGNAALLTVVFWMRRKMMPIRKADKHDKEVSRSFSSVRVSVITHLIL
ncbi:hypothetical protein MHYP_G00102910 [Metynnis hypsauchen]